MENKFKKEDKEKVVEFLNKIADDKHKFKLNVKGIIQFYGMLTYMQKELIPKIESNILEVTKVVESDTQSESTEE